MGRHHQKPALEWTDIDTRGHGHPGGGYYVAEGEEEWGQDYSGTVVLKDSDGITVDETHYMVDESDSDFTSGRYPNGLDTDQKSDWKLMKATPRAENVLSIRS